LVGLSVATSIDAFAIGVSLAMLGVDIWTPSAAIGLITAAMSVAGIRLGRWLGAGFGRRMELVGGVILIAIGIRILLVRG
jgi:putative Mn2+ efflux pump MntP